MTVTRDCARSSTMARYSLAGDIEPLLDQHPAHPAAFRTGLMRDQILAEHVASSRCRFVGSLDDLDAATLAAAAGMNLRFDHAYATAKLLCCFLRLFRRRSDDTARHYHAEALEDFLGLEFVNIH